MDRGALLHVELAVMNLPGHNGVLEQGQGVRDRQVARDLPVDDGIFNRDIPFNDPLWTEQQKGWLRAGSRDEIAFDLAVDPDAATEFEVSTKRDTLSDQAGDVLLLAENRHAVAPSNGWPGGGSEIHLLLARVRAPPPTSLRPQGRGAVTGDQGLDVGSHLFKTADLLFLLQARDVMEA